METHPKLPSQYIYWISLELVYILTILADFKASAGPKQIEIQNKTRISIKVELFKETIVLMVLELINGVLFISITLITKELYNHLFLFPFPLQPDGVDRYYFKLKLLNPTQLIAQNIKCL